MTVFIRKDTGLYSYDFQVDGVRYSGPTATADRVEAIAFEKSIRLEIPRMDAFCLAILRKAKTDVPKRATAQSGYIYMLRSGYFIKIGHSQDPADRLKTINTSTPDGCDLLFCFPGSIAFERKIHKAFSACHHRGEWFFLCGKLRTFVERFEMQSR